ncbi:MAG: Cof-type HAD-IIB family hydrolase [Planctomycetaceae bacterium]|nr:Cof-type HAD-IIB family hydrolase [Planctomycetaceae bacterium]
MRIVASDYDGTLYERGKMLGDVAPAIRAWRAAGNLFGFATGRDFYMTAPEADKWGLEADFYVCLNGGAIFDSERRLLHSRTLEDSLIPRLIQHPAAQASMHLQLSGVEPLRVVLGEGSWFPRLGFEYEELSLDEAMALRGLGQISVAYTSLEECARWDEALRRDFGDAILPHRNKMSIDINPPGVDKASGLGWLLLDRGWSRDEFYVVGDGVNDVSMIREFGGFTVPGADPAVVAVATKTYPDVPAMLEALG